MITLSSPAFTEGHEIPRKYTGDGEDVTPPLSWSRIPPGAKELALIVDDPDAPTDEPWVHWILYKIPAQTDSLAEGIAKTSAPGSPAGAVQGKNSWGKIGYGGPAPPRGHGVHHYHFKLYVLDAPLDLQAGLDKHELLNAMSGHVLGHGELVGTYKR
jgi:Raf kinase inhibitor-like YbhB/YbcL family protein